MGVKRGEFVSTEYGYLVIETCYQCKTPFAMSEPIYRAALQRREAMDFYCPNGHSQHYLTGESDLDKMRRERDRLTQRLAQKDDDIRYWQEASGQKDRKLRAAKGQITKIKNRATKGLCPCCNRHFTNLERHMGTKHPSFIAEPSADEHVN
jgi:hypothetical protein